MAKKSGTGKWLAGCAILFITFLAFSTMTLDQGLFEYYEQVRHARHQKELQRALGFTLTPDARPGSLRPERLKSVRSQLARIFATLPKNRAGRVSAEVMRYMANRYFSHKHAWYIKGFEPHKNSSASMLSDAHILKSKVPQYCQSSLEGGLASTGFSLDDATTLVAGVEQLIFDEIVAATESAYHINHLPINERLSKRSMLEVVYSVLIETMMEGNFSNPKQHARDKSKIHEIYPPWQSTQRFIDDLIDDVNRERSMSSSTTYMRASQYRYGFEETAQLTTRIAEEFGPWVNYECTVMKESLAEMDVLNTGRVKLSEFWHSVKDGQWQFKESKEYLRNLGALDEADVVLGPQVLIPNYVYAKSNCIMSTPSYAVCCLDTCEEVMRHLEEKIEAPTASAAAIQQALESFVPHFSSHKPSAQGQQSLNGTLRVRLEEIAAGNEDNQVPIHGRLFAQWLHYAFPRDCAYPHEVGSVNAMTLGEWLEGNREADVSDEEVHNATKTPHALLPPSPQAGVKMWSVKEELLSSSTPSDNWAAIWLQSTLCVILVAVMLVTVVRSIRHLLQFRSSTSETVDALKKTPGDSEMISSI